MKVEDIFVTADDVYELQEDCYVKTHDWGLKRLLQGKSLAFKEDGNLFLKLKKGDLIHVAVYKTAYNSMDELKIDYIAPRFKGVQFKTVGKLRENSSLASLLNGSSFFQAEVKKLDKR